MIVEPGSSSSREFDRIGRMDGWRWRWLMFDRLENLLAHSTHNMLNTNIYISVKREREREMNTQSSDHSFASKRCGQHLTQPTSQKWPADTTKLYIWFATSSSYFNQQNIYERGLPQYYLFYLLFPVCCCCYVCPVRDKTKKKKYHRRVHLQHKEK